MLGRPDPCPAGLMGIYKKKLFFLLVVIGNRLHERNTGKDMIHEKNVSVLRDIETFF
jgi:hypothetical protein